MSLFEKQEIYCCVCGRKFMTDFTYCGGKICSSECLEEFNWLYALYVCGIKYTPKIKNKE